MSNKGNIKSTLIALKLPLFLMVLFWLIAVVLWLSTDRIFYLMNFGYIGSALGIGIGFYSYLPKKDKLWGRRLAQFLVGIYMLVFLGVIQRENMQIEGFFLYLFAGIFAGSVIHYLVAKVVGPIIFNRGWCGWACWTVMILDLLPFKRNMKGRLPGKWGNLRYLHFGLSLALLVILWFEFDYRIKEQSTVELVWLISGNAIYYAIGIILAYLLQDNRAFCKYVCPIPTIQKLPSQLSLMKIRGDLSKCNNCGACTKMCPMDIKVSDYIMANQRVLSTECIMCMECVNACSKNALDATFEFDFGNVERLNQRN